MASTDTGEHLGYSWNRADLADSNLPRNEESRAGRNGQGDDQKKWENTMVLWLVLGALQASSIGQWIERLGDDDVDVRAEATRQVVAEGHRAVGLLLSALGSCDSEVRARASEILLRIANEAPDPAIRVELAGWDQSAGEYSVKVTSVSPGPVLLATSRLRIAGMHVSRALQDAYFLLGPQEATVIALQGTALVPQQQLLPYYDTSRDQDGLTFRFKGITVADLLEYVTKETGWIIVLEKECEGVVDAVWEGPVPRTKVIEYLNAVIRNKAAVILNPYSPGVPQAGQLLQMVHVVTGSRGVIEIE